MPLSDHPASSAPTFGEIADMLAHADTLVAAAVAMIARLEHGAVERATGLTTDTALRMVTRRTRQDATEVTGAVDILRHMPATAAALGNGTLSWSQARAVVREARNLDARDRASLDGTIDRLLPAFTCAEPEQIVWAVEDAVSEMRADRERRRETNALEHSYLVLQPRIDGYGGTIYGRADTDAFATIARALDEAAAPPVSADDPGAPSRAQQRLDALVALCETALSSNGGTTRPRPRFLATYDVERPDRSTVLAAVAGRPLKLTRLTAETLLCDAEIQPVAFRAGHPIGVGDARPVIPPKVRAALVARDGGCRFPGCGNPASWCDGHHLKPRSAGGDASLGNLALFCRRCHVRIHRQRWLLAMNADGSITFRRGRDAHLTFSRVHAPCARE